MARFEQLSVGGEFFLDGTRITSTADELNIMDGVTATASEINAASDNSAQDAMSAAAGFLSGTGTIYKSFVVKQGTIIKTEILIDLTGAQSSTTDLDIIGDSGVSYIGQITAAINGTIWHGQMTCVETPAGGADDIDLYSAVEDTGAFDGDIASLDETALITSGAAWTASVTQKIMANLPTADEYLYLTSGEAGTAAAYSAGRLLIELWGV